MDTLEKRLFVNVREKCSENRMLLLSIVSFIALFDRRVNATKHCNIVTFACFLLVHRLIIYHELEKGGMPQTEIRTGPDGFNEVEHKPTTGPN